MIKLGDEVRDKVSGFQGIAVCKHIYLGGCDRISIQPPVDKEGKLPEAATFDEYQLEVVEKEKYKKEEKKKKPPPGGPHYYPPKPRP